MSSNESALRELSVDYPSIGRRLPAPAHHNIARAIIDSLKKFDPEAGTLTRLARHWQSSSAATLVLSSELFEEAEVDQIGVLRDTLFRARPNEEFRIVLVLRDLMALMLSSYAQKVKFGVKTHDFDQFYGERMQARRVNYFQTAERWAKIFGWDAMRLRLLDRDYLVNGDLIDDFMAICGIKTDEAREPTLQRPRILNTSPGWKVLEAARALFGGCHGLPSDHLLTRAFNRKKKMALGNLAIRVGEKKGWNDDRGQYFTRPQAQDCVDTFAASIDGLNACLPNPFPLPPDLEARGFRPREFLPDVSHIRPDELRTFYDELRKLNEIKSGRSSREKRRLPG